MATLSYAYADSVVWLEDLALEPHPMVHDLCRVHAETIRVPRGWELRDAWSTSRSDSGAAAPPAYPDRLDLVGA